MLANDVPAVKVMALAGHYSIDASQLRQSLRAEFPSSSQNL